MKNHLSTPNDPPPEGQMLIYRDGSTHLQVRIEGRTVWLTQRLLAELYQVSVKTVNEHLINVYAEGELVREATVRSFRIVQREGVRDVARTVDHYNLDAVLAVDIAFAPSVERNSASGRRHSCKSCWSRALSSTTNV